MVPSLVENSVYFYREPIIYSIRVFIDGQIKRVITLSSVVINVAVHLRKKAGKASVIASHRQLYKEL